MRVSLPEMGARIEQRVIAMQHIMRNFDQWSPVKVIHVHVPAAGLDGVLVVDNVATGPAIGGLRMATDVSAVEASQLARRRLERAMSCRRWRIF